MRKTWLIVAVLLTVLMPLAFAGGNRQQASSGRVQLTIWTLDSRMGMFDPLVREYMAANPNVQITVSYFSTDGIKDALHVAASSRTLPDMWFNWGGSLGGFYAENNMVYDFTNYAKEHSWDKIFSGGALQLCTLYGKLAGYPTSLNVLAMYYRKDIFERLNLTVPATFEEFERVCDTLVQNGIIPMTTGGLYGWHTMRYVEQLIEFYAGPDLHNRMSSFQASYNQDSVVRALAKYKEWVDKGYFPPGFVTTDPGDTVLFMASGRAAMDLQGQWYDGTLLQNDQNLSNYGTFPFPSRSNRLSAFAEMMQFNANISREKLDAGVKLMDFLYGHSAANRYGQYYNLPLPRLDSEMPRNMPNVAQMFGFANRYGTFTITDQAFPTEVADVLFNVQDALANNQITPQQGAANIQTAIESYQRSRR